MAGMNLAIRITAIVTSAVKGIAQVAAGVGNLGTSEKTASAGIASATGKIDGLAARAAQPPAKARVEDALHATQAAVEEGIVPGGGVALIRAKAAIAGLKGANEDQDHGMQIALRAMEAPLREIVTNAGDEPRAELPRNELGATPQAGLPLRCDHLRPLRRCRAHRRQH